jgi:hypothetical protein
MDQCWCWVVCFTAQAVEMWGERASHMMNDDLYVRVCGE